MSQATISLPAATAPTADAAAARAPSWARRALSPAFLAVFGGWTAVGLLSVAHRWALGRADALTPQDVLWIAESMWLWALITPAIFYVSRRWPLERGTWRAHLGVHVAAALGLHTFDVAADLVFGPLLGGVTAADVPMRFISKAFINLFSYAAVAGIAHAVAYQREAAERRARAAELERQLLEARLQALESQIHPHFLFNTLNSVASLIRAKEDRAAIAMLVGLSDLLRLALRNRDAQEVPLREELEFVDRYLAVERIRFQDRLLAEVEVAPGTPLDALVPHLILQPLVENAIRHGVEARAAAGQLRVTVRREDGMLHLSVSDDGPGPLEPKPDGRRGGIGLGNTRERLRHLYGERHRFSLAAGEAGGAVASVAVPFRQTRADA